LEFASLLAEENGARLISVFMQPEPAITPAETFARGKGMLSVIEVHRAELEGSRRTPALFEDVVRRHGIPRRMEIIVALAHEVACLRTTQTRGYCPPERGQMSDPPARGMPGIEFRSANHPLSTRSMASRVRRILVGWNARARPSGRSGCCAPVCARRSCRVLIR